jgi:hypothetical protein
MPGLMIISVSKNTLCLTDTATEAVNGPLIYRASGPVYIGTRYASLPNKIYTLAII